MDIDADEHPGDSHARLKTEMWGKCCVVACNEQNGNPAGMNWRRVGEVEGGHYPNTQRHYLSMGCNHCLEPSCMIGCPTEAYTKDPQTGVVVHSADTCIGCQYCTWNCSYGVPQYNPARGVVGKCDLCHNRLADGQAPACANACPEQAIQIEIVDIARWRAEHTGANAPGLPSADDSISTTRVTLPAGLPPDMGRVDTQRITTELPHWPLVFMLVLTQLAVGAFTALWMLDLFGFGANLSIPAIAALSLAGMSLGASTLHLGRPIHAWRAVKGLRRSWLSREVLTLSLFAGAASAFAGMLFLDLPGRGFAGFIAALCGAAGAFSSARIYIVKARPAWFSRYTIAEFFSTTLFLGPLFVQATGAGTAGWLTWASVAGGAAQFITQSMKFLWMTRSEVFELRASSLLLTGLLKNHFLARMAILLGGGLILPLAGAPAWATLALALSGEWLGRWLFFVSVVPKNIAAAFTSGRAA
ncbi:MAG: 4Fe-4S ferredoxin [Acidobacteria bacterium]|nr:4Fe-4S ferredoxin [Acidobacteriota bacterium]